MSQPHPIIRPTERDFQDLARFERALQLVRTRSPIDRADQATPQYRQWLEGTVREMRRLLGVTT